MFINIYPSIRTFFFQVDKPTARESLKWNNNCLGPWKENWERPGSKNKSCDFTSPDTWAAILPQWVAPTTEPWDYRVFLRSDKLGKGQAWKSSSEVQMAQFYLYHSSSPQKNNLWRIDSVTQKAGERINESYGVRKRICKGDPFCWVQTMPEEKNGNLCLLSEMATCTNRADFSYFLHRRPIFSVFLLEISDLVNNQSLNIAYISSLYGAFKYIIIISIESPPQKLRLWWRIKVYRPHILYRHPVSLLTSNWSGLMGLSPVKNNHFLWRCE